MTRQYRIWNMPFKQYESNNLWSIKPDGTIMWGSAEWPEAVVEWDTGLKDKNGKKIFEGDICHCVSRMDAGDMVVIFEKGEFRMVLCECYENYITDAGYFAIHNFEKEIIGNIHDNPELLEV